MPTARPTKPDFAGLRVLSLESRMADELARLIERHGGTPITAPSVREVPLEDHADVRTFADRLIAGQIDIVILLTGVGTRMVIRTAELTHPRDELISALGKVATVARGSKSVAALRELGLSPTVAVGEPSTWHEVVAALDEHIPVAGRTVAVQEYGRTNDALAAALEEREARVERVVVYRWALPEDTGPLAQAVDDIAGGNVDIVLFTSAIQIKHLLQIAEDGGRLDSVREGFKRVLIASIGTMCTEALHAAALPPDLEPDRPRMGFLLSELARWGPAALRRKRVAADAGVDTLAWRRIDVVAHPAMQPEADSPHVPILLRACRCEPTDYTPVWLMRQAGRYMREYRELRARHSFLDVCKTPELAADVTLRAVDRLGVDAAIIFADILLILEPLGVGIRYAKADGPVIDNPVRTDDDIKNLREPDADELCPYVCDALRLTRRALDPDVALIGFAGAPFTVASYLIEGHGSRHYRYTKSMMHRTPAAWHALMGHLVRTLTGYLNCQIAAGAQVVQLFDSWVGCLSPDDYREFVLPHSRALIDGLTEGVPVIHFGTGTGTFIEDIRDAGGDVIGVDWRVRLDQAWARIGHDRAIQGNLDPTALFAGPTEIRRRAREILDQAAGRPGHIFNLGHGIQVDTPVYNVHTLIDAVHEYGRT